MKEIKNKEMNCKLSLLQQKLLDILKWFHLFCEENNLKYYAIGGTMLGVVRHKGFIPWDDDIDVGMPREDYNKFIELTKNKQFDKYVVESIYDNNKDFFYPMVKIYDTTTTLIENTRYKIKRGLYIDVFPLDGVANTEKETEIFLSNIYRKLNFLLARTTGVRKGRKFYKNFFVILSRLIPNLFVDEIKLLKKINVICSKNSFYETKYSGCIMGAYRYKEIMLQQVFGSPRKYKFENLEIYGVEKYNEYLTNLYGNYMQLPPLEKRVSHHDFILLDLSKSYLEY